MGVESQSVVLLLRGRQVAKKLFIQAESIGGCKSFHCHPCTGILGIMREMRRQCKSTESSEAFWAVDSLEFSPEGACKPIVLATMNPRKFEGVPKCLCEFDIPDAA